MVLWLLFAVSTCQHSFFYNRFESVPLLVSKKSLELASIPELDTVRFVTMRFEGREEIRKIGFLHRF